MKNIVFEYWKERLGWEVLEESGGFISYKAEGDTTTIHEFYVDPLFRGGQTAKKLMAKIEGRMEKGHSLFAYIHTDTVGYERALGFALKNGAKIANMAEKTIQLKKEF